MSRCRVPSMVGFACGEPRAHALAIVVVWSTLCWLVRRVGRARVRAKFVRCVRGSRRWGVDLLASAAMAGRTVQLRVGGQTYRVLSSAGEEELQRLAAVVDQKLASVVPPGRPVTPQAMLLAALALAHDL